MTATKICALVLIAVWVSIVQLSPSQLPNNCICSKQGKCKCCNVINFDHKLREIHINDTVCTKIRSLKRNTGFRFAVYWNKRSLVSHRLTTNKIPPFCFATPHLNKAHVCLLFKRLTITSSVISGCFQYEIDSQSSAAVFHGGCFRIRRKPSIKTDRPHGNPLRLLHSSETKRISITDKYPLHNFKGTLDGINKTSLALWMKIAKYKTAQNTAKPLLGIRNKTDPPISHCGCGNLTLVVCQCCAPIVVKETRITGCVNVTHTSYSQDLMVMLTVNQTVKIKELIPGQITKKVCTHYKTSNGLKVGVCIKPAPHKTTPNTNALCIYIDARKPQFRFKHKVGCTTIPLK